MGNGGQFMLIVNFSVCSNESQRKENALPRTLREKFFQIWEDLWQSFYCGQRIPWPLNLSLGNNADDLCKESTTNVPTSQTNKQTNKENNIQFKQKGRQWSRSMGFIEFEPEVTQTTFWLPAREGHSQDHVEACTYLWLHPQASFPFPLISQLLS